MILKSWACVLGGILTLPLLAAQAWGESSPKTEAPAPAAAGRHESVDERKIALPEYYGVSAIDGGKTIEISPAKEPADFSGDVEFIVYDKSVAGARSDLRLYRISADGTPGQAGATNVPSDAVIVDSHAKPVPNQPEMIRVIPVMQLEPGFYQLTDRVRFYVRKSELRTVPLWECGFRTARSARQS